MVWSSGNNVVHTNKIILWSLLHAGMDDHPLVYCLGMQSATQTVLAFTVSQGGKKWLLLTYEDALWLRINYKQYLYDF